MEVVCSGLGDRRDIGDPAELGRIERLTDFDLFNRVEGRKQFG